MKGLLQARKHHIPKQLRDPTAVGEPELVVEDSQNSAKCFLIHAIAYRDSSVTAGCRNCDTSFLFVCSCFHFFLSTVFRCGQLFFWISSTQPSHGKKKIYSLQLKSFFSSSLFQGLYAEHTIISISKRSYSPSVCCLHCSLQVIDYD